jgi:hypothetical protein
VLLDGGGFPLPDTFGRADFEMAAGMIVLACALYDDKWQPVSGPQIAFALTQNIKAGRQPWAALRLNPARPRPAFMAFAERGFARFTESDRERSPIELTDKALDLIRAKWFRPGGAVAAVKS